MIRSVDTNVLVRLIARDEREQVIIAEQLFFEPVILLSTVLQETVWVLSNRYKISRRDIADQILELARLPTVIMADDSAVRWAMKRFLAGADFADMLHLALSRAADCFATFDKAIARYADHDVVPVETL